MQRNAASKQVFSSFEEFLQECLPDYWNRRNLEQPKDSRDAGAAAAAATFRKIRIDLPRKK